MIFVYFFINYLFIIKYMKKIILLFDVDGTLTPSGDLIQDDMKDCLERLALSQELNNNIELGIVGGGNYEKIKWQMKDNLKLFKYVFCECGSVVYIDNKLFHQKNLLDVVDRLYLNEIIRDCLKLISNMPIIYSGHQIEFRKGLIYVSPAGMQASKLERDYFKQKDIELNLRNNLIESLKKKDKDNIFDIVLGGEIGIAIYPKKWDKSQVLEFLNTTDNDIYYFGDKTEPEGNDYPIYSHPIVKGISVKNYNETIFFLNDMMNDIII